MKKVAMCGLVVLCTVAVACTTVVVKDAGPEVYLPGEMVESVDANTILVKCTGIGTDQNAAITNARKGCLEWMITNNLAQKPGERQAYLGQQKSIMAKLDRYVGIPPPGTKDGKGKGVKSRVRVDDERIKVIIITDVHKKALEADLVAMGVIESKDQMLDAVGRPSIATFPFKASKGSKLRGMMQGLLTSYL
ncbi:MAG: hypothetical protein JRJ87_09385, partial [Deltaproteobacteria bacterium]|nr:hypothetical protein [Deltaproteobacteria bacterium]